MSNPASIATATASSVGSPQRNDEKNIGKTEDKTVVVLPESQSVVDNISGTSSLTNPDSTSCRNITNKQTESGQVVPHTTGEPATPQPQILPPIKQIVLRENPFTKQGGTSSQKVLTPPTSTPDVDVRNEAAAKNAQNRGREGILNTVSTAITRVVGHVVSVGKKIVATLFGIGNKEVKVTPNGCDPIQLRRQLEACDTHDKQLAFLKNLSKLPCDKKSIKMVRSVISEAKERTPSEVATFRGQLEKLYSDEICQKPDKAYELHQSFVKESLDVMGEQTRPVETVLKKIVQGENVSKEEFVALKREVEESVVRTNKYGYMMDIVKGNCQKLPDYCASHKCRHESL